MRIKKIIVLGLLSILFMGCKSTPTYQSKILDSNFSEGIKKDKAIAVLRFDSWIIGRINGSAGIGGAFGALGVLIENSLNENEEIFGINLQNESMKVLAKEFNKVNSNYKAIDLGKKFSNKELTKRYKSNRMWGFSALKKNEVLRFFADNPSIDYAIHIQSRVRDPRDLLFTDTDWFIYDKKAVIIAEINTSSVEKLENDSNTGQDYFNKALKLQKTNINEFLKLISKS